MVDNVLNNGFGEKERREEIRKAAESYQQKTGATITFFAAVCEEFPSMGNYFDGLTVEQVTDRYKQILADPRLSYMGTFVYGIQAIFISKESKCNRPEYLAGDRV